MEALRKSKIERVFQDLDKKNYDSQGYKMTTPPECVYQALAVFLNEIPDGLFFHLSSANVERLQRGAIIVLLKDRINKGSLGITLGEGFVHFFHTFKMETLAVVEKKEINELLSNETFANAINLFIERIAQTAENNPDIYKNEKSINECSETPTQTQAPIYLPAS